MRVIAQRGADDLRRFLPGGGAHAAGAKGDAPAIIAGAGCARHSAHSRCSGQQSDDLRAGICQRCPAGLTPGGVALGPKPRSYRFEINKKVKRIALQSAFSSKVETGDMIVVDAIKTEEYKTKTMAAMLKAVGSEKKALIVLSEKNDKIVASVANIPGVKTAFVNTLNVYDILNADKFIVVKDAVAQIEEVYA